MTQVNQAHTATARQAGESQLCVFDVHPSPPVNFTNPIRAAGAVEGSTKGIRRGRLSFIASLQTHLCHSFCNACIARIQALCNAMLATLAMLQRWVFVIPCMLAMVEPTGQRARRNADTDIDLDWWMDDFGGKDDCERIQELVIARCPSVENASVTEQLLKDWLQGHELPIPGANGQLRTDE